MKTSIAISTEAIVSTLLAETALRHHLSADRPPLLTRDQTPALIRLAEGEAAAIAAATGAAVSSSCDDVGILTLEMDIPATIAAPTVRLLIEKTVASRIAATAYAGVCSRTASAATSQAAETLAALRSLLSAPATIVPSRI